MPAAPPETLTLDHLTTPVGIALLVTDEAGWLRAFNWTDYEARMLAWIARHYPDARLGDGRSSPVRKSFEAYFAGETAALNDVPWRASGTTFQLRTLPVSRWSHA